MAFDVENEIIILTSGPRYVALSDGTYSFERHFGTGNPNGSISAPQGSEFIDAESGLRWQKTSAGVGTTGWTPTASLGGVITHSVAGALVLDALEYQHPDLVLNANVTDLSIINLEYVQTYGLGVTVNTPGAEIVAMNAGIDVVAGVSTDITAKGTISFRRDNHANQDRCWIAPN